MTKGHPTMRMAYEFEIELNFMTFSQSLASRHPTW